MFCTQCGAQLEDDAAFCTQCGNPVPKEADEPTPEPKEESSACQVDTAASDGESAAPKRASKGKVMGVVIAAAAIVVCVAIGVAVKMNLDAQATKEANEALHPVPASIMAPSFDENATRIPVRVSGTSANGSSVDEVVFLNPDGTGLELMRGTYELEFPGGYLTGDGSVCKAPDTIVKAELTGEGPGETSVTTTGDEVVFLIVTQADAPDDLIAEIADLAKQDPQSADKVDRLKQTAIDRRAAAQGERQRIETEKAAAEQVRQLQRELDEAYAANPDSVYAAPSKASDFVTLTGTVDVQEGYDGGAQRAENVCMLVLPRPLTVTGTQYGDQTNNIIILPNSLIEYQGQTVSVNTCLSVRVTASIASAPFSPIIASQTSVIRVFDVPDADAVNMTAAYSQTAVDAALALFTDAEISGGSAAKTGSLVAQYLAEGSPAAAQFANGWNPDELLVATNAQVTGLEGNVFNLDVTFEKILGDAGDRRVHIARVSMAFDDSGKITDIAADVL